MPHAVGMVRVPEVTGMPLGKARRLLERAGIELDTVLFAESYSPRDHVLDQHPGRGRMVPAGEKATLTVARESYVRRLPSIYQRIVATDRSVSRELLWIIQHLFGSVEVQLETQHALFDPREAPLEFLPWLAGWLALVLDTDWPIEKTRSLVCQAVELYSIRGTVRGLKRFIALFTDHEPAIIENAWPLRGFRIGVSAGIGFDSVILPPVNTAYAFVVEMPIAYRALDAESVIRLHEIIQREKPAHTTYCLRFRAEQTAVEERRGYRIAIRSGINIGDEVLVPLPVVGNDTDAPSTRAADSAPVDELARRPRARPPLPRGPRADDAPIEGQEGRRGPGRWPEHAALAMPAVSLDDSVGGEKTTERPRSQRKE